MQSGSSSRSGHNRGAAAEAHTIGELQSKRTQSGSSSRSARNRGAVEIGEEQPKRTQASGKQQLKHLDRHVILAYVWYIGCLDLALSPELECSDGVCELNSSIFYARCLLLGYVCSALRLLMLKSQIRLWSHVL